MNSECDELLSEILSHPSLNAASSVNAANLQRFRSISGCLWFSKIIARRKKASPKAASSWQARLNIQEGTEVDPDMVLQIFWDWGRSITAGSGKPKLSLLRRQKAEMKAQMQDLRAKIYQNQLMSLAGFSLGSYPLFNGPPQASVEISVDLEVWGSRRVLILRAYYLSLDRRTRWISILDTWRIFHTKCRLSSLQLRKVSSFFHQPKLWH